MKIALLADPHLFSGDIGGNWSEDSFQIFKRELLTSLKQQKPDICILLGDILDPKGNISWAKGNYFEIQFVNMMKELKKELDINVLMLQGNHKGDRKEILRNINEMGGPTFIDNEWFSYKDVDIYFFSSRVYQNIETIIDELKAIPLSPNDKNIKILLMHEVLSIGNNKVRIPKDFMIEYISPRYNAIFNGHQHFDNKYFNNIWCLDSALPNKISRKSTKNIDYNQSSIENAWDQELESPILTYDGSNLDVIKNKYKNRYGFYIYDTNNMREDPKRFPIDIGIDILNIRLEFKDAPVELIREILIDIYNKLEKDKFEKNNKVIVRIYCEGTLRQGDKKEDIGIRKIEKKYSIFYDRIIDIENLIGMNEEEIFNRDNLKSVSKEDSIKKMEKNYPFAGDFIREMGSLLTQNSVARFSPSLNIYCEGE